MFFKPVTFFKFFGFDIQIDASWLFLSVLIAWTLTENFFPITYPGASIQTYYLMSLAAVAGLMASVIVHEVAHAVIAEYYHMPITNIVLFIFGGVARMEGQPSHPKGEFLMAIAGPIMSLLIGIFFMSSSYIVDFYSPQEQAIIKTLLFLGQINLMIAAFNILPAFPLDGGRALRAVLWHRRKNFVLATRFASKTGYILAYLFLIHAVISIVFQNSFVQGIWSGLFAYFIHAAGATSLEQTEHRSLLNNETVLRFMRTKIHAVSPDLTINDMVDIHVFEHYQKLFPVVDSRGLQGVITLNSILSLPRDKWPWLHVSSLMEPISQKNTVPPDFNAADALEMMKKDYKDSLIVAENGHVLGAVNFQDIAAYLAISMKVDDTRPVLKSTT